jgi:hypothetical protein
MVGVKRGFESRRSRLTIPTCEDVAHFTGVALPCSFGLGLLFVNVFNVYVTTRLVKGRADTYGALGIAAALLFSVVLVGRAMILSAEVNALLDERGRRRSGSAER